MVYLWFPPVLRKDVVGRSRTSPSRLPTPGVGGHPLQTDEEIDVRVDGDTRHRQSQSQDMESTLLDSAGGHVWRRRDAIGPLQSASEEAWAAREQLAIARLRSRRLASLLMRTDQMLTELEVLNLQEVGRVS